MNGDFWLQVSQFWTLETSLLYLIAGASILILSIGFFLRKYFWPLFFLSFSLAYSCVIPPFHGPDEADHFLSFLKHSVQYEHVNDSKKLARRGHFGEIVFHQEIHMKKEWLGVEGSGFTPNVREADFNLRAPFVAYIWKKIAHMTKSYSVVNQLLFLRVFQSFLVFFVLLFCFILLQNTALAWFIGLVPAFPFMVMHVSNYSFTLAGVILVVSTLFYSFRFERANPIIAGVALGVGSYLCLTTSKLGLMFLMPTLVFCGAYTQFCPKKFRKTLKYYGEVLVLQFFICLSFSVISGVTPFSILRMFGELWQQYEFIFSNSFLSSIAVALPFGVSFFLFWLLSDLFNRMRLSYQLFVGYESLVLRVTRILMFLSLFFWVIADRYHYKNIEGLDFVSFKQGVLRPIVGFLFSFGISWPDRNNVQFFLLGFGWLDAVPPVWVSWILFFPMTLLLYFCIEYSVQKKKLSELNFYMGLLGFSLFIFSVTAFMTWIIGYNLHGRYLFPFYILFYSTLFSWFFDLVDKDKYRLKISQLPIVEKFIPVVVHTAILVFVFRRYYG